MRAQLHYLGMAIIIPVYGIQVCPFVESQNPVEVFILIAGSLLAAFLLRTFLFARKVDSMPLTRQAWGMFIFDLGILVAAGLFLSGYNWVINDFPIASGLKVLVGIVAMGLFASADLALEHEREVARIVQEKGLALKISTDFFPLTSRLAFFSGAFILFLLAVLLLLIIKDLDWLTTAEQTVSLKGASVSILKEFVFVFVVVIVETLNIIRSFTRNLNMFLDRENSVLEQVTAGTYDIQVPISSNDEFGVMAFHTNEMIRRIRKHAHEISLTRDATILTLASLAEARDNETGAHILRTQRYVRALAKKLQNHPRFREELDDATIELMYKSAPLHDIGKVGIPDRILLKPGKLTDEEFAIMKQHAEIGARALNISESQLGENSFLDLAREIALAHHEKWDGSGYPKGLKGEEIPVSGRLMAVADVYDALITRRVYKPPFTHEKAMRIILDGKGTHFDPDIIDALLEIENEFIAIAEKYSDAQYDKQLDSVQKDNS